MALRWNRWRSSRSVVAHLLLLPNLLLLTARTVRVTQQLLALQCAPLKMSSLSLDLLAPLVFFLEVSPDLVYHVHVVEVFVFFEELLIQRVDVVRSCNDPIFAGFALELGQLVGDLLFLTSVSVKAVLRGQA